MNHTNDEINKFKQKIVHSKPDIIVFFDTGVNQFNHNTTFFNNYINYLHSLWTSN